MAQHKAKTEAEKSIPEMVDEVTREEMRQMYKDGKLTVYGRRMSKFLERALPDEKVDEWGWDLSRKERAAIKRRAAEKKAAEEKKKAEARARAAYRRKQRQRTRCRSQRFRRPAGTGEEGMGESPAPVQAPRTVAVTGCGEGVNVV